MKILLPYIVLMGAISGCGEIPRSYKQFQYKDCQCFIFTDINYTWPANLCFMSFPTSFPVDEIKKLVISVYAWEDTNNIRPLWIVSHDISKNNFSVIDSNGALRNIMNGKKVEKKSEYNIPYDQFSSLNLDKQNNRYIGYELVIHQMLANTANPNSQETFTRGKQKISATFIFSNGENYTVNNIPFWSGYFYKH